jgi:four helix bundle protein
LAKEHKYDLEERTALFGEEVIVFARRIKEDTVTKPLISQIVRSATSIGANYMEANGASSKKDFRNKIYIAKKEAKETLHWLRMIVKACPEKTEKARELWKEAKELVLILQSICNTINKNS